MNEWKFTYIKNEKKKISKKSKKPIKPLTYLTVLEDKEKQVIYNKYLNVNN